MATYGSLYCSQYTVMRKQTKTNGIKSAYRMEMARVHPTNSTVKSVKLTRFIVCDDLNTVSVPSVSLVINCSSKDSN